MRTLVVLVLFLALQTAQAASFGLQVQCADYKAQPPNYYVSTFNGAGQPVTAYVEFVYQWGNTLAFGNWLADRFPGSHQWGGAAIDADSGVEIRALSMNGVPLASLTIDSSKSYPACGAAGWQPSAPSIAVLLVSDCQFIETIDENGNWSWVESDGTRVLLHYGESLIGNPHNGQSIDPTDYRAVATSCPD